MDPQSTITRADVRKLIAVSSLSAITLAFVMVLLFKLIGSLMSVPIVGEVVPTAECSELHDECGAGMVCQSGTCVTIAQPTRCRVGDPCTRECEPGTDLMCSNEIYVRVPWNQDEVCRDQDVVDFLAVLDQKCRSVTSCTSKQFSELALGVRDLHKLLSRFHDLTSMHFPPGKPSGDSWPSKEVTAHYVSRLRGHVQAYKEANAIFLVATASRGRKAQNDRVSYARTQPALDFMKLAATAEGLKSTEWDEIRAKTRIAQIGNQLPIDYHLYNAQFSATTVAWSQKHEDQLLGLLDKGDKISVKNERWRNKTINQTVFIVPVPCEVIQ